MIITVDGPSASGKSTLARALAQHYDALYIESGMLFRAFSYTLLRRCDYTIEQLPKVTPNDLSDCANSGALQYHYKDGAAHILWKGDDITAKLKMPDIDRAASTLATNVSVRDAVLYYIRQLAHEGTIVADGRDMGTVVFPEATHKFYITASVEERARRWQHFQQAKGNEFTLQEAQCRLRERDMRDETRAASPLRKPAGACEIDTTDLTPEQTLQNALRYIEKRQVLQDPC